jgi:hypothetical protein
MEADKVLAKVKELQPAIADLSKLLSIARQAGA